VVVKMENPNWSISEVEAAEVAPGSPAGAGKAGRGKNARQITWVLLLKAHRAAGRLTGAASAALAVASAARRRVASGRTDADAAPGESTALRARSYGCIRVSLVLSLLLLAVEVAAYLQGWHLEEVASLLAVDGLFAASYAGWMRLRLDYLAPPLQFLTNACVALFMVQSIDRLVLCLGCFWIRFKGIKPVPQAAAAGKPDVEAGAGDYPMVLVQMPMCNEREVSPKQSSNHLLHCPLKLEFQIGCSFSCYMYICIFLDQNIRIILAAIGIRSLSSSSPLREFSRRILLILCRLCIRLVWIFDLCSSLTRRCSALTTTWVVSEVLSCCDLACSIHYNKSKNLVFLRLNFAVGCRTFQAYLLP
jgi:hypothetical protein